MPIGFSEILGRFLVEHVDVPGYVVHTRGRARATEDVDVLLERTDEATADELAAARTERGLETGTATHVGVREAQ
ncbi:MAG: hypothetical protein ACQEQJ_04675 [Halobacteriota archaeon]